MCAHANWRCILQLARPDLTGNPDDFFVVMISDRVSRGDCRDISSPAIDHWPRKVITGFYAMTRVIIPDGGGVRDTIIEPSDNHSVQTNGGYGRQDVFSICRASQRHRDVTGCVFVGRPILSSCLALGVSTDRQARQAFLMRYERYAEPDFFAEKFLQQGADIIRPDICVVAGASECAASRRSRKRITSRLLRIIGWPHMMLTTSPSQHMKFTETGTRYRPSSAEMMSIRRGRTSRLPTKKVG